jgi:hypothetical protein
MKILQTANLGKSQGGISGSIRYSLYNSLGTEVSSSQNTGVYEVGSSTGVYGVELNLSVYFSGSIVWSVNGNSNIYASEVVNVDDKLARTIQFGRWKVDDVKKEMIFYDNDNTTELVKYQLFDKSGSPSVTEVFDRRISGSV